MNKCLLCGDPLNVSLSLGFILSFRAYRVPVICQRCRQQFNLIPKRHCRDCCRAGKFKDSLCPDCRRWRRISGQPFRNHSLYQYNSMMSKYMRRYKFQGDYRLRKVFQERFSRFVNRFERPAVLIPVHPNTYQRRGFNQVAGLLSHVKVINVLMTRSYQKGTPQSRKTRADRLRLPQPFKLVDKFKTRICGKDLLVVDDVYTTGTTIRHAAQLLKAAGAKSVVGITLAR